MRKKRRKISQREARLLRREVCRLTSERAAFLARFNHDAPGTQITNAEVSAAQAAAIRTAQRLAYPVAVRIDDSYDSIRVRFYAVKP